VHWPDQFSCDSNTNKCTNNAGTVQSSAIEFFKQETIPLQFQITPYPLSYDVPHRTFTIKATADYTYELRDSKTLEIKPQ
jgi:hypothetical protein